MKKFLRSKGVLSITVLLMIAAVLAAFLASTPGHSRAASSVAIDGARLGVSTRHTSRSPVKIRPQSFNFAFNGGHYLYVDDGTCPDSIDVYKLGTPVVHVGNYPNSGCNGTSGVFFGDQSIAIAPKNTTHGACLVFGDAGNGFVDSFPINADGSLGALASQVADSANIVSKDVHIDPSGDFAYVASPSSSFSSSYLESYALGQGCMLTTRTQLPTNQFYISFALISHSHLVTVDSNTGDIDSYAVANNGSISLVNSVPGQISAFPDSITYQTANTTFGKVTNVFTGQATTGSASVQGGQYSRTAGTFTPLTGSPNADPAGNDGAAVSFNNTYSLLIQGEQFSSALGVYGVQPGIPGTPGSIAFKEETPLAVSGESPEAFAQLGQNLLVSPRFNGDVEACTISPTGVSGCKSIAVLTNTGGLQGGIAVL